MYRIFLLAALTLAQPVSAEDMRRLITVTGEGRVSATPDMATVAAGVISEGPTASAALTANSTAMEQVIARLKALGIDERDMVTSALNLGPVWSNTSFLPNGQPVISGYQASNQVSVRVVELDKLGGLLDAVVGDGANQLNGLTFGLSETKAAEDDARRAAVTEARRKAELLASAAGLQLGDIVAISESGGFVDPAPMYRAEMAKDVPVQSGELAIVSTVTLVFELADR